MKRKTFFLCLLCAFCLQALAAVEHSYKQQPKKQTVKVGTSTREMLVYVPADLPEKAPMVISMHGASQDPNYQMNQTHWNEVADTAKILVVYPQGNGNFWDISGSGDVKFIETIMKTMQKKYHVDKNRIYISGFSMGGMMTYHCMTKLGSVVAAFGPVSGIPVDYRDPVVVRKVPIMHIHGTGDDVVKWGGDPNHAAGGYGRIDDYVKKWAAAEGCDVNHPEVIRPYPETTAHAAATRTRYINKEDNIEVTLIALDGKGHWHSDDPNVVYSTRELWNFFKQYKLDLPEDAAPGEAVGDVVFHDNWDDEIVNVGEGVPAGWKRENSMNDGSRNDVKENGAANTGGARIKDFVAGGDFNTGFYLSARDFDQCKLSYGAFDNHRLHLTPGKYQLSFNSIFWNDGSENGAVTFDACITGISDKKVVLLEQNLESEGNLKENSNQVVKGSLAHLANFSIEKEGDYELYFLMSASWAAVVLGNVKIRKADTSTGITDRTADAFGKANIITYNLSGQRISAQTKGLVIEQILFANGKKVSRKVIKK
ncbi:MAG: PHB depolymerase family esterase [Segatella copri]|nr:PHB depolymerase family esterase [Segatella copri]